LQNPVHADSPASICRTRTGVNEFYSHRPLNSPQINAKHS
jgi:hypothetical protein